MCFPPLADEDAVQWIVPPLPALFEMNAENRQRVEADVVQASPYNLHGDGINVLVFDGGQVRATHVDLAGRIVPGPNDNTPQNDHATHVAGTIAGAGVADPLLKGMAPAATIISYGFQPSGGGQPGFLYTDPGDLLADYTAAITAMRRNIESA